MNPSGIVPNMNDHVFDDDADDNEADNNDGDLLLRTDTNILPVKPCLMDLTRTRWDELAKMKVSKVRQHAKDCLVRKCDTMKYIMLQVIEMKSSTRLISMCEENMTAEGATWSRYLTELQPN
jgi:hypothetical protein